MAWPTGGISTADLDSGGDSPANARAAILAAVQQVNDLAAMLGVPLGAASLDAGGKLQSTQLPAGLIPAGVMVPYAGTAAPTGWLLAYGQAVSRATYADLFAAIGTTHGAGDGTTTFNLPDMRGRVVAGKDDMGGTAASRLTTGGSGVNGATLGATGGAETHTLTSAQIPAHNHPISNPWNTTTPGGAATFTALANVSSTGSSTTVNTGNNTGGGGAHNNTQPTLVGNYIIKV